MSKQYASKAVPARGGNCLLFKWLRKISPKFCMSHSRGRANFTKFAEINYASTILTINLSAIMDNYVQLQVLADGAEVAAVIKADAYGLGVAQVAPVLYAKGAKKFFVANLDEALTLKSILKNVTIFVLHGLAKGQEDVFFANGITPVINSIQQLQIWQQYAVKQQKILPCILHFNTGMNRLGINFTENLSDYANLDIQYIMSHLACADDSASKKNAEQLQEFNLIIKNFPTIPASLANSAAMFLGRQYNFNMVRPGIAIYGGNPINSLANPMKNAVKLTSRILQIEQVDRAGHVGYGATRKIEKNTKIATIAVGYADGYLRSLSDKGLVAANGQILPIIGRVSMDLVTIDVTKSLHTLNVGDEIELIGDNISLDIIAQKAGTISYEILTSLGGRYGRKYVT